MSIAGEPIYWGIAACSILVGTTQAIASDGIPWGQTATAGGCALAMALMFLRAQSEQRKAHIGEMQDQRELFVDSLKDVTRRNEESADRVEEALLKVESALTSIVHDVVRERRQTVRTTE